MADKKITELNALSTPDTDDVLPIVDVSSPETKKISFEDLANASWPYAVPWQIKVARLPLTNADIIALPTTPLEIVGPSRSGTVIIPLTVTVLANYTDSTIYTSITGDNYPVIIQQGAGIPIASFNPTALLATTGLGNPIMGIASGMGGYLTPNDSYAAYQNIVPQAVFPAALFTDLVIRISSLNSGNYGGGDSANSMVVTVVYIEVDVV